MPPPVIVVQCSLGGSPISLGAAAEQLYKTAAGSPTSKSKPYISVERRLYDIGSILFAVGLIGRAHTEEDPPGGWRKQPHFAWLGVPHATARWTDGAAATQSARMRAPKSVEGAEPDDAARRRPSYVCAYPNLEPSGKIP